ncbi:XXXCH domain-containing protein [Desulfatibacillum alkenivorans DSM 16219]|jgi:XXXCH domain-containing protein|uniref:XXXCH domain-containing protein n=2 Tax=Desulfatibacillum alkenivorans TaxID=259354 RepID=A0A1M6YBX1_9BACT|nr:XXXCH domain-containing protein [Desulfatibacillum alkenivorans DSM 16219]
MEVRVFARIDNAKRDAGMGEKKDKQKIDIVQSDLPDFLRRFADAWEKKGGNPEFSLNPDAFSRLEIKAKTQEPSGVVRVRLIHAIPEGKEPSPEKGKINFKALKKRMKSRFKAMGASLRQGEPIPEDALDSFVEDYRVMMEYLHPKESDPEPRMGLCKALSKAHEKGDATAQKTAVDNLRREMKECHKSYD